MKFFAPKTEPSKVEVVQVAENTYDKVYFEPTDSTALDESWVQSNDADSFNNYTEEY